MLTFQIGLHIDDLFILEYIKNKLNCGHISISGKNVIILLMIKILYYKFYYLFWIWVRFYSSKYHQCILFEKVVNFIKDKKTFIKRR